MSNSPRIIFGAPNEEAAAIIRSKPALTRDLWEQLAAELRIRAFTITGIEGLQVIRRVQDLIAKVPEGADWEETRQQIADALEQDLGSRDAAMLRAETLLRTQVWQATQAAAWREFQADPTVTHLQYIATRDDRVRPTHLALHGLILPKDDPFWDDHYPPWDWGCRCQVRPLTRQMVDRIREAEEKANLPPDKRRVLEGPALERLRQGQLIRDGQAFDVTAPRNRMTEGAPYWFRPDLLLLEWSDLQKILSPEDLARFEAWAAQTELPGGGTLLEAFARPRLVQNPLAADVPPETRELVRQLQERLHRRGEKLPDHVISAIEDLPSQAARVVQGSNLSLRVRGLGAQYSPFSGTVRVAKTPTAWSGHRSTILHEFGHAFAHQSGAIKWSWQGSQPSQELLDAMARDRARWNFQSAEEAWQFVYKRYPGDSLDEKKRRSEFADMITALTSGRIDCRTHPAGYWVVPGNDAHEAFAHAFRAVIDGDPAFYSAFPNVTSFVRSLLGL